MASTELRASKIQALTTGYLATEFEVRGAKGIEVWLDDPLIAFTVRYKTGSGGDYVFREVAANGTRYYEGGGAPGQAILVNVKAASGTPNAHILPTW
jgi:hypothetical protein